MKLRLLLVILSAAALLGGCVSTSGYRSSHSVGVGYSHGRSSVGYGYQGGYPGYGYPGSYGYGSQDYYRDRFYGDDYYRYGPGYPSRYDNYGYRGYPYAVPRYRVIHPGNGYYRYPGNGYYGYPGNGYYGDPYSRRGYQGHTPHRPRVLPPRHGGRPPWRNVNPPITRVAPPPVQPGNTVTPDRTATPRPEVERGLRRYKGGELPPQD